MSNKNTERLTTGSGRRLISNNLYAKQLFDKLSLVEDAEERLNVDLISLFEALDVVKNCDNNYKQGFLVTFQHMLVARKITQKQYDLLVEVLL